MDKKRDINSALQCYIVAGNYPKACELWRKRLIHETNLRKEDKYDLMRVFVEKALVLKNVLRDKSINEDFDAVMAEFASLLAHDGHKWLALHFM